MSKPLDERVKKILKELDFDPKECLWDCHGTWVMYHRFVEIAGVKNKINYELWEIERNSIEGIVCIKCHARTPDKASVVTYGEASPKNNKNAYPYAMAEKRAVDRAILKLLGLHGFIYSEDEMDMSQVVKTGAGKVDKEKHPNEEAYNALDADDQAMCTDNANLILEAFTDGILQKAHDELFYGKDSEYKQGLFHVLKDYSEIRNKLNRMSQEKALRAMPTQ